MIHAGGIDYLDAYYGEKRVLRLYLGDFLLWEGENSVAVTYTLDGVVASGASTAVMGESYTSVLTAATGKAILPSSVVVTMGSTDITSTAYNSTTNTITIASVTDEVAITATAVEVIAFEDDAVKAICVANWGGSVFAGEITADEAALVTSLADKFKANTDITKFNELRYFTGLTSLYSSGTGDSIQGQFHNCSALTEVTLPAAPITDFRGGFRYTAIVDLDLSPTTATSYRIDAFVQGPSSGTTALRTVKLPGGTCTNVTRAFRRARGVTTLTIDGTLDLSQCSSYSSFFDATNALETITGTITGIKYNINLASCPLTVASALVILNGLSSGVSSLTCTFKSSMRSTYEADTDFNAAVATASANGWTIAYA